jgi:hypothetical protein
MSYIYDGVQAQFSPADFPDSEDMRPLAAVFDIGGQGSSTPYTTAINSMINKGVDEIKSKNISVHQGWKKKMKDFMTVKNNELLEFLHMKLKEHPVMGPGEILIRRFGNPQIHSNHPSIKEMVLDMSGADVLAEINEGIVQFNLENPAKNLSLQAKYIYEKYRDAGDDIIKQQNLLRFKLEKLDGVQGKIIGLFEIDANEQFQSLMESVEKYLAVIYAENSIEAEYIALLNAYRRFAILRELVQTLRVPSQMENEPLCSICIQEPVSFTVSPCGHVYCSSCIKRQINNCFICRGPVKDRVKLFFG